MIYTIAYCANNLGDDIFVRMLLRRYPQEKFYLYASPRYTRPFRRENNICLNGAFSYMFRKILKLKRDAQIEEKTQMAKAIVRIGGSIFIERDGWEKRIFHDDGNKTFIIGANFGPYKTEEFKQSIKNEIMKTKDCCFRDKYSYDCFSDVPQVRWAPDIVFGYEHNQKPCVGDFVGISIIDFSFRKSLDAFQEIYENGIVDICRYYQERGIGIKLFGFCDAEGDKSAIERIMKKLDDCHGIDSFNYNGDIDGFIGEMNTCKSIFATRFHSMILGWILGKNVVPIIYSDKLRNVIKDIEFSGYCWDIMNGEEVNFDMINNTLGILTSEKLNELKQNSQKQFQALDDFLMSN